MQLIRERPPLFDEIDRVFNVKGKPILFAWGSVIYAPSGVTAVHPAVEAHEKVHGDRQLAPCDPSDKRSAEMKIWYWWRRYLDDPVFRLEEEKLGHLAEYQHLVAHASGRSDRRRHLSHVAARLCQPLYGYDLTKAQAMEYLIYGNR